MELWTSVVHSCDDRATYHRESTGFTVTHGGKFFNFFRALVLGTPFLKIFLFQIVSRMTFNLENFNQFEFRWKINWTISFFKTASI